MKFIDFIYYFSMFIFIVVLIQYLFNRFIKHKNGYTLPAYLQIIAFIIICSLSSFVYYNTKEKYNDEVSSIVFLIAPPILTFIVMKIITFTYIKISRT